MMAKLIEFFSKVENLEYLHKGSVLDNADPKKLGRLKVNIPGIFEGKKEELPWCFPMIPYGLGGSNESTLHVIPEVGTELIIAFPYGDIYFPMYVGYYRSDTTKVQIFETDYPESYGWRDSIENLVLVNKKQKSVKVVHGPTGSYIVIDEKGNVVATNTGDLTIETEGYVNLNSKTKYARIKAKETIKLDAPVVQVEESLEVGDGASGAFSTASGHHVVVTKGIVTSID